MKNETVENKNSYLSFKLGNETFAIAVQKVLEVLEIQKITKVPKTPEHIKGVINFRGEILPVIDTRTKFNLPVIEDTTRTVIIVIDVKLNNKSMVLGAIADSVQDVIEIPESTILAVPELGNNYNHNFLIGMFKIKNKFIMILDIDKLFSGEELNLTKN